MILNGFVDDSGSGGGTDRGNIFVLAGFVASPERWKDFSNEWVRVCNQEPKTPDFHIQRDIRLINKDGSVRWTETERDARIKELVDLTKSQAQYRVESILAWPNYDRIVKGKIRLNWIILTFFASTTSSFLLPSSWTRPTLMAPSSGSSMTRAEVGGMYSRWYDFIKGAITPRVRNRLGAKPIFRHDKDVLPLKACDIWA